MILILRNRKKELVAKDMLDINWDMTTHRRGNKYIVQVDKRHILDETFPTKELAEAKMIELADKYNEIEAELRYY
jgi:hypothetical protein